MSMTKPTSEQVTFLAAGAGAVDRTALDKMREMVSVKDFGAVGDDVTDDTAAFEAAASYSSLTKKQIFVPVGIYRIRGLDLKGKPGCMFVGEYRRLTSGACLRAIGTANITSEGRTAFVRVNDGTVPGATQGTTQLRNLFLLETPASQRDIGLLAKGATWFTLSNVSLWGFADSVVVGYLWNSYFEFMDMVNFRTRGIVCTNTNVNVVEFRNVQATSATTTPECNFDVSSANTVHFYNLLTEGNCVSHFRLGVSTREVSIYGLHLEGGRNFIEYVQPPSGGATQLVGSFAVYGGGFYPIGTADSADRFVKYVGPSSLIGINTLILDNVIILKGSSCHAAYFDLGKVANFSSTATFEYRADPTIDAITWTRIGDDVSDSYGKSTFGHNGLVSSVQANRFCTYGGTSRTRIHSRGADGAALVSGFVIANIPLASKDKIIEIDVLRGLMTSPDFARFVGAIASNGTASVPSALVSQGSTASSTTFAYDSSTGNLTATNSTGSGFWRFTVKVTEF